MSFDIFNLYEPIKDEGRYAPLPQGTYQVILERVELKSDINGTRKWWNLQFGLDTEPEHPFSRRKLFSATTWENREKPDWEKKGRSLIADVCYAAHADLKHIQSEDEFVDGLSDLLEGKSLVVRVYHSKDKEDPSKVKEQIGAYYTLEGQSRSGQKCSPKEQWVTSQIPRPDPTAGIKSAPDDDVPF